MKMSKIKKIFITILFILINVKAFADTCAWDLLRNETWVLAEYYDILKSQNRNTLIKIFPKVESQYYYVDEHNYEPYEETWTEQFTRNFNLIFLYNQETDYNQKFDYHEKKIYIGDVGYLCFFVQNITFNDSRLNISCLSLSSNTKSDNKFIIDFPFLKINEQYIIYLVFDGDYFDLYINNKVVHKFCRIDKNSLAQYQNLIKDNTCDLLKVTWPRHADGTCDYDDKIIIPDSVKIVEELKKEFSPIEKLDKPRKIKRPIKQKGQYVISENTIIRGNPKEASLLITTIGKDSKVIVKKIGRQETINGITSNWVEINIVPGAVNEVGKTIHELTTGWIFGGYLK